MNRVGDLFRRSGPAHGSGVDHGLDARVNVVERNHAGRDGIHRDARRKGFGEGLSEHDDSGFRSAVMGVLGPGANAAQGTNIHNASRALRVHLAGRFLAAEERALQVHVVNEIPIGFSDFKRVEAREAGGVVHQAIERPKFFAHFAEKAADFRHLREIGLKDGRAAALARNFFGVGARVVVVDGYLKAAARKFNGKGAADALGCAGDENARTIGLRSH